MEKEFGIIISCTTFQKGDKICHINNYNHGFILFFTATDTDVKEYSGKNGTYLKLIQTNPDIKK